MKKRNYLKVTIGGKERLLNVSDKTIQNLEDVIKETSRTELEESCIIIYEERKEVTNVVESPKNSSGNIDSSDTNIGEDEKEKSRRKS